MLPLSIIITCVDIIIVMKSCNEHIICKESFINSCIYYALYKWAEALWYISIKIHCLYIKMNI